MKKVVLLAGALAAGMAVAPVTANAAPAVPRVQEVSTDLTSQGMKELYHGILDTRSKALDDIKTAVAAKTGDFAGLSPQAETEILANISKMLNLMGQFDAQMETYYNEIEDVHLNCTVGSCGSSKVAAFRTYVENYVDKYVHTTVSDADFQKLTQSYLDFAHELDTYNTYQGYYDTYKSNYDTFIATPECKQVDNSEDVKSYKTTAENALNALSNPLTTLGKPSLSSSSSTYGVNKGIYGGTDQWYYKNTSYLSSLVSTISSTSQNLKELVALYHSDRADLLGKEDGHTGKMFGSNSDVYNLKALEDGFGTGTSAVMGYKTLKAVDPTTGDFLNTHSNYSNYYKDKINAAKGDLADQYTKVMDYIETFDAANPTTWRNPSDPNYHMGESATYTTEAGYKAGAVDLLKEFQDKINALNQLIKDAKDNVKAYNALVEAEAQRQSEMNSLRNATTTTVDNSTVSYWEKHREVTENSGNATNVKEADGGTYLYRTFIKDLQKGLNNVNSGYDLNLTADKTDIHDQIIEHFNAPVEVDGVPQDAEVYQTQMTADGVIFGTLKGKISTLKTQIADNESANKTLHSDYDAKIVAHANDMYTTCVGYEDITADMFTSSGKYYGNGTCEDVRSYLGYDNLWRSTTPGDASVRNFINAEVDAYNSFNPADATTGAMAWLNSTAATGAPAMKQAVDNMIERLWNHVATDQLEEYLEDVDAKMTTEFDKAKNLDKVCRNNSDTWSWTVPANDAKECKCEANDTNENPCGWCDPTAKAALKVIRTDYNTKTASKDSAHKGNATAAEATYVNASTLFYKEGTAKSLVSEFKTYADDATKANGTIDKWLAAFKTADEAHDKKLKDTKAETDNAIHKNIHEVIGTMSLDAANFDTGDTAAADKWAKALTGLNLDLDGDADTFTDFKAFVKAVENAEALYTAKALELYNHHHWSKLNDLLQSIVGVNGLVAKSTYKQAVEANRTAKAALLAKVEDVRSDVAEAKNEAACEDRACKADIAAMFNELETQINNAEAAVNSAFDAGNATAATAEVDALAPAFGLVKKQIDDLNAQVRASKTAAADMEGMIKFAFGKTDGAKILEAQVTGYENFKERAASPAITLEGVKYFNEIEKKVQDLKDMIAEDDSHAGGHVAATNTAKYLEEMANIQAELDKLVEAINANEEAHNAQLKHRDELYKKYECYDTTGLEAAVKFIKDPDFSLDSEFPEVPGYPETAVDPAGKDHTKAHTAVAEAIKALDDEIEKHYKNGASNVEAAKTKIGDKETEYITAFQHAQTNDSKFMTEYGKCTEAAQAVKYTYENWKADHFANGANKYSDEANVQVTKAYDEMVAAKNAYLKDIKTDWYNNKAVEKVDNNATLLDTYKEKINAYNAAVEKAQKNDQEFDKQLAAHVVKPLTAEATYTYTRVVADPVYVTLKAQLTALNPDCNNAKFVAIQNQIIQDWEDEKSELNGTAEAVAAYQAAAQKYNELMANLNAYGDQLVKYFEQKEAFDAAKNTIDGYDIMVDGKKNIDGADATDYDHKKDIVNAISNIDGKLNTLYNDMKTEAEHVAETINDADLTNNEVNEFPVDSKVGTIKTLIENLGKDAKAWEDACDANQAAFEPLHDNIKTVEVAYAEDSANVTDLPEPAQEAFNLAVKNHLEALAKLQEALEDEYMKETAATYYEQNKADYDALLEEIEEMYGLAVQAGANLGDIDFDGDITVYDSNRLVDIVLYNSGYAVKGDFDFDGENTVNDVIRLNNLLWYEHIEKAWAPGRVAFEGDIELTAEGNTVALALNNNAQANGIQFDITLPEGGYIDNVLGTDRVEGMRVLTACIADNTYRVLVISTLNASTINDNEGAIVTFNVCGGNEVEVSNVIATDGNSHRLNGAAVSVGVTTSIDEVASEGETDIFSLDGIRQGVMKAGVNIVRGVNGVAKKIFNK